MMPDSHPDDVDGPNRVTVDGIEWTIHVSEAIDPNSIFLVNEDWLNLWPVEGPGA